MLHLRDITPCNRQVSLPQDQLEGWFKLNAIRPDGRRRPLTDWIPNLITNAGLDNFGVGGTTATSLAGWIGQCAVGTGNSAPAYTDTELDTELHRVGITSRNSGVAPALTNPFYRYQRTTYIFPQGTATGIIAEIGVGPSGGDLSTRALVVDQLGDPSTVPVLADEQLEVVYEIRTYFTDVSVRNSTIVIDSVTYDTKRLPALIGAAPLALFNYGAGLNQLVAYKGDTVNIGVDEFNQPLNSMETENASRLAYNSGNHYRDSTVVIPTSRSNNGVYGVTAVVLKGYLCDWQMSFTQQGDPTLGIPHTNQDDLHMTIRHSWVRYEIP